jgi:hypothetical protein
MRQGGTSRTSTWLCVPWLSGRGRSGGPATPPGSGTWPLSIDPMSEMTRWRDELAGNNAGGALFSMTFSLPELAVQTAVLDRLGDMLRRNGLGPGEVGNGARHFEDTIVAPGAQTQAAHGAF